MGLYGFLVVLVFNQVCFSNGVNVPTYQNSRPERVKVRKGAANSDNIVYRVSYPSNVKPPNRAQIQAHGGFYLEESPISDAIHIVDPPKYFQEQKKVYREPSHLHLPQAQAQVGLRPRQKRPQPTPPAEQYRVVQYDIETGPVRSAPIAKVTPQKLLQEKPLSYNPERKTVKYTPPPRSVAPQKFVKSHHAVEIQHPKPKPTYVGIQTPNYQSIRNQVKNLKERQKYYFEDEQDERPVRPPKPTKEQKQQQRVLGYDVFLEGEKRHNRLKDEYLVGKTYAVVENTTPEPRQTTTPFTPYRLLASVRHTDRTSHTPRTSSEPRAKERLKTKKVYTVYSEQGFQDVDYDHGDEQRHSSHALRTRRKRDISNTTSTKTDVPSKEIQQLDELPVALALVTPDGKKLSGKKLLKHIATLVKNASKYLPSDSDEGDSNIRPVIIQSKDLQKLLDETIDIENSTEKTAKATGPIFNLNPAAISDISAIKYAEKLENFNESPYSRRGSIDCEEVEPDFDQNEKKKKLGRLNDKLECMKTKLFGSDPLGGAFFKEDLLSETDVKFIAPETLLDFSENAKDFEASDDTASDVVYHDVMKHIEKGLKKEKKMKLALLHLKNEDKNKESSIQKTRKLNTKLALFDITKYLPQYYMIKPNGKIYGIKFRPQKKNKDSASYNQNPAKISQVVLRPPKDYVAGYEVYENPEGQQSQWTPISAPPAPHVKKSLKLKNHRFSDTSNAQLTPPE